MLATYISLRSLLFWKISLFLIFLVYLTPMTSAQVVINEVCSDNTTLLLDNTGTYNDWIELYNPSDQLIDLTNYAIADRNNINEAWIFPTVSIPAKGYLLIFASDETPPGNELHTDFKIAKEGEQLFLWNNNQLLIEQMEVPALAEDESYGRQSDGTNTLGFFSMPTPGTQNEGAFVIQAIAPYTSDHTRFYASAFSLPLFCDQPDCVIRYTTDGSWPNDTSLIYQSPIEISTTTTLRYASFLPNGTQSTTITSTYFIDSPHELPVVNLTMSPEILFDEETGIFLRGPNAESEFPFYGANYWNEEVFPAHLEFFNTEQELEIDFSCGAKIHGGTVARTRSQKPIRLLAKNEYGISQFNHTFFDNKEVSTFERLILRNTSGDFNVGNMRDGLMQRHCAKQGLNIDLQGYKPMAYYVNGIYFGIINLREKVDEYYLQYNYDVDIDQLDLLEQDTIVIKGDFEHFDAMEDYVFNHDLSEDSQFEFIRDNFDLESMADYFITQTFYNNLDWPRNNLKFWRKKEEGAKWRYLLFDLDAGMGRFGWTSFNADGWGVMLEKTDVRHVVLLRNILTNQGYLHYVLNRYADLLNTSFSTSVLQQEINYTANQLWQEMGRHMEKWGGDYDYWQNEEVPRLLEFAEERPSYARQYLIDYHQLEGLVDLRLNTYPQGAGTIKINTIQPESIPWEGIYFKGIPVTITVEANPGYTFSHWGALYTFDNKISDHSFSQIFDQDDEVTAFFLESPTDDSPRLFPNPATDQVTATFLLAQPEMVNAAIYTSAGQLIKNIPTEYLNAGLQELSFSVSDLATGVYFLKINQTDKIESLRFVVAP